MLKPYREVTDEEWACVSQLIPELRPRDELRGRKGVDARVVLNSALWVIANNKGWARLPPDFPPYQTCHRRWKAWLDSGVFELMVKILFGSAEKDVMTAVRLRASRRNEEQARRGMTQLHDLLRQPPRTDSRDLTGERYPG